MGGIVQSEFMIFTYKLNQGTFAAQRCDSSLPNLKSNSVLEAHLQFYDSKH